MSKVQFFLFVLDACINKSFISLVVLRLACSYSCWSASKHQCHTPLPFCNVPSVSKLEAYTKYRGTNSQKEVMGEDYCHTAVLIVLWRAGLSQHFQIMYEFHTLVVTILSALALFSSTSYTYTSTSQ